MQFQLFEKFPSAARFYSVNKLCSVVRFMAFCLQNSCRHLVNNLCFLSTVLLYVLGIHSVSFILKIPGRHSINIAVSSTFRLNNSRSMGLRQIYLLNSSGLPFRKHNCVEFVFSIRGAHLLCKYIYFLACSPNFWTVIQKIFFISLSGDENDRSIAIHFHIAFRINSQSVQNERTPILLF